ncbi:transposase [Kitasatospora purpeofusca]|uniref:transposase n=1 Tax=Kitasatospora purpeofusca TaxID=67352 RepID=UPI00386F3B07
MEAADRHVLAGLHLACDGRGRPLGFVLTGGNTNDCTRLEAVLEDIRVPRVGPGRPRTRPDHPPSPSPQSSSGSEDAP